MWTRLCWSIIESGCSKFIMHWDVNRVLAGDTCSESETNKHRSTAHWRIRREVLSSIERADG
jgi:hypothetical protein